MYCPRCGQEQISAEARFCSRCGFDMRGVSMLLPTGGLIPGVVEPAPPGAMAAPATRAKGVRLGAKVIFASLVSFPLMLAISIMVDGPGPLLLSVLLFLIGFFRVAYAALFEEGPWRTSPLRSTKPLAPGMPQQHALPSYQTPVSFIPPARTTGELETPPSVTEHTTRHLQR